MGIRSTLTVAVGKSYIPPGLDWSPPTQSSFLLWRWPQLEVLMRNEPFLIRESALQMRNGPFQIRGSQTRMRNGLFLIGERAPQMRNTLFQIRGSQTQMRNELFLIRDPGLLNSVEAVI